MENEAFFSCFDNFTYLENHRDQRNGVRSLISFLQVNCINAISRSGNDQQASRIRKLKLAPISEDLACPTLLTSSNGLLPRLLSSFSGALGIFVALCGVLASIAISQHLIQLVPPSSPALTTYLDKNTNEQSKEAEPTPQVHSRNVLTLPSPIQKQARVSASPTHLSPNLVSIPTPKHAYIEFLEELEFENPFAEEALATKPTRPSLKDKKAEEQKRMALQRAALAQKKAKNATLFRGPLQVTPKAQNEKISRGG